jgi:hypothetical protein
MAKEWAEGDNLRALMVWSMNDDDIWNPFFRHGNAGGLSM